MFGKTNWVLKGVRGAHAHAIYVLEKDVILGRSADADIQILDQRVSRQHARIFVSASEVVVEDLGSHNGTFVHGHKVHRRPLQDGDRLRVGVSEYVFGQVKGKVLTSAIFLNKLSNKDTMGVTAVTKRVTRELLSAQTAEMPMLESSRAPQPQPSPEPRQESSESVQASDPEPAYLRDHRERAIRLPTPAPGELEWRPEQAEALNEPTSPASALTVTLPPGAGLPLEEPALAEDPRAVDVNTVPLDPRSQRVHTPRPASIPSAAPEPRSAAPRRGLSEQAGLEAAVRTIDAVVRLLKLRARETSGGVLRIQDRENLRRLEGALRETRRNRENRRRWSRLPCRLSARVGEDGGHAQVTDIGAGGLRISGGNVELSPGTPVTVRVHMSEGPLARIAVFPTKVAWVDRANGTFGAIFAGPAHWELPS